MEEVKNVFEEVALKYLGFETYLESGFDLEQSNTEERVYTNPEANKNLLSGIDGILEFISWLKKSVEIKMEDPPEPIAIETDLAVCLANFFWDFYKLNEKKAYELEKTQSI